VNRINTIGITLKTAKIKQAAIAQVRERHVVDTASNVVDAPRMTSIPTCEHFFDDLPL
jgi:hypothetical protein